MDKIPETIIKIILWIGAAAIIFGILYAILRTAKVL